MSFENRIYNTFLIAFLVMLLVGALVAFSVVYTRVGDDSVIQTETLRSIKATPKAKYIPAASGTKQNADISNARPSARSRKPLVINL